MTDAGAPPAVQLNLAGGDGQLETFVDTVIVFHGPGSWKRDAYWDEYVLSLANRGSTHLTLLSAHLIDAAGAPVPPGTNWEKLESDSRKWWDGHVFTQNLALGASAVFVGVGTIAAPVGVLVAYAALHGIALSGVGTAFIAVPVAALWLGGANGKHEQQIAAEFNSRRLELPLELSAHTSIHSSLFFRLTPSPRRLVLTYREAGQLHRTVVELPLLADLHRQPGTPAAPPPVGEALVPLPAPAESR
jgi:hypothetical protein